MFDDQTSSDNIVWWSNILRLGHLVWWCLMMFDDVWLCLNSINHWIKQHQTFLLSSCLVRLARCIKHVWLAHARCVIADSAMLNSVWFCGPQLLAFGCLTMFDKTSFNRLARALNIKMFDHQTMLDNVWLSNTSRLARALKCIWNEDFYFAFASCYMSNKRFENWKNIFISKSHYSSCYIESLQNLSFFSLKVVIFCPKSPILSWNWDVSSLRKHVTFFFSFFFFNKICRVIFTFFHLPPVWDFSRILLTSIVVLLRWWTRKNNGWMIENHSDFGKVLWTLIFFQSFFRPS